MWDIFHPGSGYLYDGEFSPRILDKYKIHRYPYHVCDFPPWLNLLIYLFMSIAITILSIFSGFPKYISITDYYLSENLPPVGHRIGFHKAGLRDIPRNRSNVAVDANNTIYLISVLRI